MSHDFDPCKKLTFGKYKGHEIGAVSLEYLRWLLEQDWFETKYSDLIDDVQGEVNWREERNIKW